MCDLWPWLRPRAFAIACALAVGPAVAAMSAERSTTALVAAYDGTGQRLFQAFAAKPNNVVLSPYSIGTAMAMVLVGARGDNEAEMAKVLGLALPRDEIADASASLTKSLKAVPTAPFQLSIANAVMLAKQGGLIAADYVALLRDKFAADVFRNAGLDTVNDWVKQQTDGKIPAILDRLDPNAALVLLDAIYFKAKWQRLFDPHATRDGSFHLLDGEAQVPTMHMRASFALAERPGYRAIRLPYQGDRLGMVIVLPDAGNADLAQRFGGDELQALLTALRAPAREVALSLPRFHATFKADLVQPFAAIGMRRAFDTRTADFSGMTGKPQAQEPLAIDQVVHSAVVDVGEEGTQAAAATSVSVVAGAVMRPQPPIEFNVDRPFLFAIVDDETGAVLFEGRIVDPRA
jgi:serpin B